MRLSLRQSVVFVLLVAVLSIALLLESSFITEFISRVDESVQSYYQPEAEDSPVVDNVQCIAPSPSEDVYYSLFLVITTGWSLSSYAQRQIVRDTWLKEVCLEKGKIARVGYVFVLGNPRNEIYSGFRKAIEDEQMKYEDIIILPDFEDSYRNLSFKTLSALKWAAQNRHFDYLMKTDDDSTLNLRTILKALPEFQPTDFWMGIYQEKWLPWLDAGETWSVVPSEIPREGGLSEQLPWTNGFGYFISKDVVKRLDSYLSNETENEWPKIFLEDINTAMVLKKKLQVHPKSSLKYGLKYDYVCERCHEVAVSHHCYSTAMVNCANAMKS
jgi:hypothetical protein